MTNIMDYASSLNRRQSTSFNVVHGDYMVQSHCRQ